MGPGSIRPALRTVENRLVLQIQNKTDDPIQLLGERSTVVDPGGQSHPLASHGTARRYDPLNGGTHGGWLDVRVLDRAIRIERKAGRHVRG